MAEDRREPWQLGFNLGAVAIPAKQRAQHKTVAEVMQAGLATERVTVKAGGATALIKPAPDVLAARSSSPAGNKEGAGILGMRAQLAARADVFAQRGDRAGVKRDLARSAVLGLPDGEPPLAQLDIGAVKRARF